MRPLIIDDNTKKAVQAVIDYAELHPFSMDDILDVFNKEHPRAGDMKNYVCMIPMGYRVVYSIELQNVKVRHISISVDTAGKMPNLPAVEQIIKLFGFKNDLKNCAKIDLEDLGNNHKAVNVWDIY